MTYQSYDQEYFAAIFWIVFAPRNVDFWPMAFSSAALEILDPLCF